MICEIMKENTENLFSTEGEAIVSIDKQALSRNRQLLSNSVTISDVNTSIVRMSEPMTKQDFLKNCFESEQDALKGDSIMGNSVEQFILEKKLDNQ